MPELVSFLDIDKFLPSNFKLLFGGEDIRLKVVFHVWTLDLGQAEGVSFLTLPILWYNVNNFANKKKS